MAVIDSLIDQVDRDGVIGPEGPTGDWMKQAACKGLSHLFFAAPAEAAARAVCGSCVVNTPCRQFARVHHEYGFWGGESEDERHAAGYRLIAPIGIRARAS